MQVKSWDVLALLYFTVEKTLWDKLHCTRTEVFIFKTFCPFIVNDVFVDVKSKEKLTLKAY